ncbi:hypothetical protein [uncultured Aquimarina sp.]|uniref:hypothetical protein n=1 Tax=uncultured Aquimarina sp. TaxID=575652 RepID=UPI00260F9B04|nr:hypothetical protein [uncultured Aquimarina sp.]
MKIAVLAWGSLIWNPQTLKINKDWNEDGPMLPIEFARISNNGRLTLVIKPNSKAVQVLWTLMDLDNLEEARINLQKREETPSVERIGFVSLINSTKSSKYEGISEVITKWAMEKKLDAVIWTDLGVKFKDKLNKEFNPNNVLNYLKNLPSDKKVKAKEYIIKAPKQIRTEIREVIEKELVWKK